MTRDNAGLQLIIAVGYGGHWDIAQAASSLCRDGLPITAQAIEARLVVADVPHPDLLIRTGGSRSGCRTSCSGSWPTPSCTWSTRCGRISTRAAFAAALSWYASRDRRYGRVPEAS